MNPTAAALCGPRYYAHGSYGFWPAQVNAAMGTIPGSASGAAAAGAEAAAAGAFGSAAMHSATAPHPHGPGGVPPPRYPYANFNYHGPTPGGHGYYQHALYRRGGPRLFPILLVGGVGAWAYHKASQRLHGLEDENDALRKAILVRNGEPTGLVPEPIAAAQEQERRRWGGRWGDRRRAQSVEELPPRQV